MNEFIKVRGARQHNLKNINLDIPKNKLVIFTGISGSGKSSLAFDTIYAEGQRRYVESLSTYARQFLGIMEKPDVDSIEGLSPAISIDQKTTSKNPRSTVGTVTEIYDYLRLLFARIGHPHCPICHREITHQTADQIVQSILDLIKNEGQSKKNLRFLIFSPVVSDRKGEFTSLFQNLKAKGYKKIRIDGFMKDIDEDLFLLKNNKHSIDIVVDRMSIETSKLKKNTYFEVTKKRLHDSVGQAISLSEGNVIVSIIEDLGFEIPDNPKKLKDHNFTEKFACPKDNIQISEIEPRSFSFNSPHGACENCSGLGKILKVDPNLVFSKSLSILEGGILPFSSMFEHDTWYSRTILEVCSKEEINVRVPIKDLGKEKQNIILNGTKDKLYQVYGKNRWGKDTKIYQTFPGIIKEIERRYKETESEYIRYDLEKYMRQNICEKCMGSRLKKESLSITILGKSISEITNLSVSNALIWITSLKDENIISDREKEISGIIVREIQSRLNFLLSVGLEYITLGREAQTLSGGEAQRIRLASQIGSGLSGVLYVLDEPTIGLHQKDNLKLINTLKSLRDLSNSVVVVEHDREMIERSDYVFDFGPLAGDKGGEVIAHGTPRDIINNDKSLTGKYLSGKKTINIPKIKSVNEYGIFDKNKDNILEINGCSLYNLKNINVSLPLGKLVCITGVSGSGKSSLLVETLYPALQSKLNTFYKGDQGIYTNLKGYEDIEKVILIDQSPIGRTPRSNPATYIGLFDIVREVYANTKEARTQGYKKGRFSFNLKGGRCETCEGQGQIKIEMQFLNDIWIYCEQCKGKRYNSQTLDITHQGKNISDVLNMTVDEANIFFANNIKIKEKIDTLLSVGLGYMKLGQSAITLSGGEAQRIKLSAELSKRSSGKTVYILDEPTTGLHFADIEKLLKVLRILVSKGNSVFLIEHNMDVIKNADWIIDLGPDGGDAGGYIVAQGTVLDIKKNNKSYTGLYL